MKDFFVSYNAQDRRWAEWIAWELEEDGFSVTVQAWDFAGNWIVDMDRAMRECERTVAVLSPAYVAALYTHSEWANAFRLDPTGTRGLLLPVRVAPVELDGILAQHVYVDLVDAGDEAQARQRLLARARRQRGKPPVAPGFPGAGAPQPVHAAVARRPPYPAAQEDSAQLRMARALLLAWRERYALQRDRLHALAGQARAWRRTPPAAFDDAVGQVIDTAGEVADALADLPVSSLEFALDYGLGVHETVFWGQALSSARHARSLFDASSRATRAALDAQRRQAGLPATDAVPDPYGFEMLARVLEAAVALLAFDLARLPRGFVAAPAGLPALHRQQGLFLAQIDDAPGLQLMSADDGLQQHGTFGARTLALSPLAARLNRAGTVDLVACDGQHLYYFADSSTVPTAQYPAGPGVLAARFLSDATGAAAALARRDGSIDTVDGDGTAAALCPAGPAPDLADACLWTDPLDPGTQRRITAHRPDWALASAALDGSDRRTRGGAALWQAPAFTAAFGPSPHWTGVDLTLDRLQGLDCVIARATADWGAGVQFLDPLQLTPLRAPLAIPGFAGDMAIAGGRWLVVAFLQDRQPRRLAVWDLANPQDTPVAQACHETGDAYAPLVLRASAMGFRTVQVFRTLHLPPAANRWELLAFDGPHGGTRVLQTCQHLRLWPVT